jgi:hypothetical protein
MRRSSLGSFALLLAVALAPATAVFATATTDVVRETVPFVFDDVNPCNGEVVTLTGELRLTTRTTVDSKGGFHLAFNLVPSEVRGEGASGVAYKATGGQREHFNVALDDAPTTDTFTSIFNLVGQGGTDNFVLRETFHVTVNATGGVTVLFDKVSTACEG